MLVYRLETEGGWGVYRGDDWTKTAWYIATGNDSHDLQLTPEEDNIDHSWLSLSTTRFGWQSVNLYLQWVDEIEWRQAFEDIKVKLCVYEVPDHLVITRSCQCVFNIDNAKLVEKLSPLHFD